ncbi:MAG: hypothetical protein QM743_07490 [Chitinophagaceae bacterium]
MILAHHTGEQPTFSGLAEIASLPKTDFRLFGKPSTRPYRRMGVVLCYDDTGSDIAWVVEWVKEAAAKIGVS